MRVIPSNAIEMTSAYLDRAVTEVLVAHHVRFATPLQKQDLASVIHLCGAGAGDLYVHRGLRLTAGQKCGDHEARVYVGRVDAMKRLFARLAAGQEGKVGARKPAFQRLRTGVSSLGPGACVLQELESTDGSAVDEPQNQEAGGRRVKYIQTNSNWGLRPMNIHKIVGIIGILIAIVAAFVKIPYAMELMAIQASSSP